MTEGAKDKIQNKTTQMGRTSGLEIFIWNVLYPYDPAFKAMRRFKRFKRRKQSSIRKFY